MVGFGPNAQLDKKPFLVHVGSCLIKDIIMQLSENSTDPVTIQIPQADQSFSAEYWQGNHRESVVLFCDTDATVPVSRFGFPVPAVIADAGPHATKRYFEFFTATIRNRDTRRAYDRSADRFFAWCAERECSLHQIRLVTRQ